MAHILIRYAFKLQDKKHVTLAYVVAKNPDQAWRKFVTQYYAQSALKPAREGFYIVAHEEVVI